MNQPNLSHALTLEAPERVIDGAGGFTEGWVALGTLWAEMTSRTGRQTAHQGSPVSRMSYKIVVRGAPFGNPQRPKAKQRFRHGSRIFTIQAVAERDPECRYLTCFADEELVV